MSGHDAFERILTSLHEAMLDDVHWPTTTALIDEACGLTSNALLVGEGPKDDLRVLFAGLYYRGQRRETWNESTSRSTIPSTNVCRACGNCPTRGRVAGLPCRNRYCRGHSRHDCLVPRSLFRRGQVAVHPLPQGHRRTSRRYGPAAARRFRLAAVLAETTASPRSSVGAAAAKRQNLASVPPATWRMHSVAVFYAEATCPTGLATSHC